jgi:hypothetical protein
VLKKAKISKNIKSGPIFFIVSVLVIRVWYADLKSGKIMKAKNKRKRNFDLVVGQTLL